jgi:AGZA family xanthine/uracil permease-like MFS transporter
MGLWARLPFALAPGMEINGFVAFFVVGSLGFGWQRALGAVFWSGVLFVVITTLRLREKIIGAIPQRMKTGLSLCVGVFLCLIALKIAGLLIYDGMTFRGFGDLTGPAALSFYLSLALILLLEKFEVRGAVLISIVVTSAFCAAWGVGKLNEPAAPTAGKLLENFAGLDLKVIVDPAMWGIILILFLVDFYGSVAKLIGIALNTSILTGGRLPRMREALMIDGAATMLGSVFGTSSIVVYVESAVGIGAGGRTGLTALTCGLLMMVTFVAAPVIEAVPVAATTGALVFVATKLCPTPREVLRFPKLDILILAAMPVIVIFTFSLDQAMLVGFVLYATRDIAARRAPNPYLVGSIVCLIISLLLRLRGGH